MVNLSATVRSQSTTSKDVNTVIFNASMQQVAANKAQRNNNHNRMMQLLAMMSTTSPAALFAGQPIGQLAKRPQATTQSNFIPQAIPILAPAQQWGQPPGGGHESTGSRNGRGCRNKRGPAQQGAPVPFVGGNQMIPYIPACLQPLQQ